jgi:hypothetical protein
MRLRTRMLVLGPAIALATVSLGAVVPGQALAGSGISQYCEDNGDDIPLLTSPITLGVEAIALVTHSLPTNIELCYSTNSYGNTSPTPLSGSITVNVAVPGTAPIGTNCASDSNGGQIVTLSCTTAVAPSASFTPASGGVGGTLSVAIPISFCLGSNLTGTLACGGSTPTLGNTGVIVGNFSLTGPAGYPTGITLSGVNVIADGIAVPLIGSPTSVGVHTPGVDFRTAGQSLCVLFECVTVPNAFAVGVYDYTAAQIVVAGITFTVPTVPGECFVQFGQVC